MRVVLARFMALLLLLSVQAAGAATLRVAPTILELTAPDQATTLRLRNESDQPLNVQLRVFSWHQSGGADILRPSDRVVASPPATRLAPGMDYTVRIIRTAPMPVRGEESYRLLVDELPRAGPRKAGRVRLLLRHSIPVFFRAAGASPSQVDWGVKRAGGRLWVTAHNSGSRALRVADILLRVGSRPVAKSEGLVGYVLGGSTVRWPLRAVGRFDGGPAVLTATSQLGPIQAALPPAGR